MGYAYCRLKPLVFRAPHTPTIKIVRGRMSFKIEKITNAYLMEIGAEKLRYLTGVAIAVNHKGRIIELTLDDIYRKSSRAFRIAESEITQATY